MEILQGTVRCQECGSTNLEWGCVANQYTTRVIAYLGCNECSETVYQTEMDNLLTWIDPNIAITIEETEKEY